jgi:osmotically-inducible protein OsmY
MKFASPVLIASLVASFALPACAPLIVAGVVAGTAVVATDRRTTGTLVDDQTIQLRVSNELSSALKGKGDLHISVNSFERRVLLTGEVPTEEVKAEAGAIAARSLNVRAVTNELTIAPPSTLGQRTNDTTLSGKVRAAFVNTREIAFNSVEIVTERGIVYLLGVVTEKEGEVAAYVASRVAGVHQVVKVFDYASAEEVQRRRAGVTGQPAPAVPAAPATAPAR